MGVLDLMCVTTDPDKTTFYGFAFAEDYSSTVVKPQYAVLVKSNTHPPSSYELTWSVVSMFDGSKLNGYPDSVNGNETSCTVSAQGVFTMFGRSKVTSTSTDSSIHFGIRYDPQGMMESRFNFDRVGAWMNITVADGYSWSGDFRRRALGYTDTSSNSTLFHVSINDMDNTINLATVNESTKTLAPAAVWTMNSTLYGSPIEALTVDNGRLYTFGFQHTDVIPSVLARFPINTISQTTPISTIYNTTTLYPSSYTFQTCYYSPSPFVYVNHGSLTLICGQESNSPLPSVLHRIEDTEKSSILGPAETTIGDMIGPRFFVPIVPATGNSSLMLVGGRMEVFAFGLRNDGRSYVSPVNNFTVPDLLRSTPIPLPPPPTLDPSSTLPAGGIVGIVIGVVILAGIVFLWVKGYRIRRNKDDNSTTGAVEQEATISSEEDDISICSEKVGDNDGPNYLYLEGKYADSSNPDWRTESSGMLPMAPITPVPEHLQAELEMLQEMMREVQERIQAATQFSSHPRPSVVTTVSYKGEPTESDTQAPDLEASAATSKERWEPMIFAPPAESSQITDIQISNAPAYSSVISQSLPEDSPDIATEESVESGENVVSPPSPLSTVESIQHPTQS